MYRALFLDDYHVAQTRGIERIAHPARRFAGNPVMEKRFPWERMRMQLYGRCIIFNPERRIYQMYYMSQAGDRVPSVRINGQEWPGHSTHASYAESHDGIEWDRPFLGQCSFEDEPDSNLLEFQRGQSFEPAALYDENDPDPERRLKMFYWDQRALLMPEGELSYQGPSGYSRRVQVLDDSGDVIFDEPYNDWGMDVAFSPDGIRWHRREGPVFRCYSDTGQSVLYDERLARYVAFGRFNNTRLSSGALYQIGRGVARVTSSDFINWSEPELVLSADALDPESFQINSMPLDLYEGIFLGLMEVDVRPSPDSPRPMQLAMSRDGVHWTRLADRNPMLEMPSQGAWDDNSNRGCVRPGTGLHLHDDQVRFYYNSGPDSDTFAGLGMAYWRRDGFYSLRAGGDGGEIVTAPFVPDGEELHLNINAAGGEARVTVCDRQGGPMTERDVGGPSSPVRGDSTDVTVVWDKNDLGALVGNAIALRIELENADLYAFWTE